MKYVKLIVGISGTVDGRHWPSVGSVIKVENDDRAADMVLAGIAEYVDVKEGEASPAPEERKVETATAKRAVRKATA